MKFAIRTMVAAAASVVVGVAQATVGSLAVGGSITTSDYSINSWSGSEVLTFSSSLLGALNLTRASFSAVAPATTPLRVQVINPSAPVVPFAVTAPITSLTGDFAPSGLALQTVGSAGGALINASVANITTNGGALQITNLNVDLANKRVYADLIGGNNVGVHTNVYLWDIATITGSTNLDVSHWGAGGVNSSTATNTLSGLTINAAAFDLFATSLGLTANGITSLKTVTDYGVINSTVTISSIPEPETCALMGLGLAGISLATRRRRASCHPVV